ncbi:MAG: hypothetical protein RM368_37215 [Nostoc sp. DedSLP03]|uniref:hypothetical protein n=1 Tax=Nostoc sp. DedSLP03 TaxID=3075400 RepID=UPI002AD3DBAF|nr:hypothetical protein [Nostoc sp. DedSLP03]MDZ7970507.1 hypothetical protein [Nostoc sp. DedSLP03]
MANNGIFRNVNIIKELNAASGSSMIQLYQPGILNSLDIVNNARYSGFITSLRLTIDITSITELQSISNDILASDATIASNNKATFDGNQKKALSFYLQNLDTPLLKIMDVYLFNQRPYYYIDVLKYFTSSSTFDVAPDTQMFVQMTEVGNGLLLNNDRIIILGSAIEESPIYDQSFLSVE